MCLQQRLIQDCHLQEMLGVVVAHLSRLMQGMPKQMR